MSTPEDEMTAEHAISLLDSVISRVTAPALNRQDQNMLSIALNTLVKATTQPTPVKSPPPAKPSGKM